MRFQIGMYSTLFSLLVFSSLAQEDSDKIIIMQQAGTQQDTAAISPDALDRYNEGISAFEQKMYKAAISHYSAAIDMAPNFSKAYLNRAYARLEDKDIAGAESDFIKATELDKTLHQAWFELGIMAEITGEMDKAIELYGKAIKANNKEPKYYYQRGLQRFNKHDYKGAKDDFTVAIGLKDNFAFAYNDRGSANRELGDLAAAIKDYQAATVHNPKLILAFNNLGTAYRKKGEYDNAINAYTEAIKKDKTYYLAFNNRGFAKYEKGDYEGAIKDFQEAIKIKADYAFAYNNMAGAYLKLKKYEDAVKAADKAIQFDADYGYAYYNRGIAYEMLRNELKSCEDWKKAAELGVEVADTYYQSGGCN